MPSRETVVTRDLVPQPREPFDLVVEQFFEDVYGHGAAHGVQHL